MVTAAPAAVAAPAMLFISCWLTVRHLTVNTCVNDVSSSWNSLLSQRADIARSGQANFNWLRCVVLEWPDRHRVSIRQTAWLAGWLHSLSQCMLQFSWYPTVVHDAWSRSLSTSRLAEQRKPTFVWNLSYRWFLAVAHRNNFSIILSWWPASKPSPFTAERRHC
jgi:hypothetical protein